MVIKESSDELNAPAVTAAHDTARPPRERTTRDYLALTIATAGGIGFIPIAPGTWGAVIGILLYLLVAASAARVFNKTEAQFASFRIVLLLGLIICVVAAGIWAATHCERLFKRKDPGAVVIDEVAGQLIAFVFVPANVGRWSMVAAFIAFRVFDIWKPYPISHLEALESGLGIMADDVLAGVYAAISVGLMIAIYSIL
jgi:phosphatidylglycerophosphatase A